MDDLSADVVEMLAEGLTSRGVCEAPILVYRDGTAQYVRCSSNDSRACEACAAMFKGDVKRVIGSGCRASERDGVTADDLAGFRWYFWTLTAGSFGRTHWEGVNCFCGRQHERGSGWAGVALDPRAYDYAGQVAWNNRLGRLWNRTTSRLALDLPDVEHASVREWQARGALHVHALVRVPAWVPDGEVRAALATAGRSSYYGFEWGAQQDVRLIAGDDSLAHGVRYLAKALTYTVKSVADDHRPSADAVPARVEHFRAMDRAARFFTCMHKSCGVGCPSTAHKRLGFGGHRFAKSKGWSLAGLTRTALKEERRAWAEAHASEMGTDWLKERAVVNEAARRLSGGSR